jgi:signal transduction histidine kinase
MLHEFLVSNRDRLIRLCRSKVAGRPVPGAIVSDLHYGIPLFLDQLIETFRLGGSPCAADDSTAIRIAAGKHGGELQHEGFTVEQVVHDYGDLCQAITQLAAETGAPITVGEFETLNRCLDYAIAGAVTEFGSQREMAVSAAGAQATNERIGRLAHELRNLLGSATLALAAIKTGKVGFAGTTGAVLDRNLLGLRELIDRVVADVRLSATLPLSGGRIRLLELIHEMETSARMEARVMARSLSVLPVDSGLAIDADRQTLTSAVANLLQNAFKFSRPRGHVSLHAYGAGDRVLIEVADECGGLPQGTVEELFQPFKQRAGDRTGLGLGLSIAQRAVKANGGLLRVRDVPGTGCVFTIDLPRAA